MIVAEDETLLQYLEEETYSVKLAAGLVQCEQRTALARSSVRVAVGAESSLELPRF